MIIKMEEIIKKIINEYPKVGYKKTADMLNISLFRLKNIIHKNNINLPEKIRKVNINNFTNIDKKEVAYFLGFFWSDGSIFRDEVKIEIKSTDGSEISNVVNSFGKWRVRDRIKKLNNKKYKQTIICINDKYIKEFLIENDFNKKSLDSPTKILQKIPNDLKNYFFRGLIDGDGCFCSKNRNYFSITGNMDQNWFDVEELFNKLDIKYSLNRMKRKQGNSSYVVVSSKLDIIKLGNYLYGDYFDGIGLERKYNIYKEIKEKPGIINRRSEHNRYVTNY